MTDNPSYTQLLSDLKTGEQAVFISIQSGRTIASRLTSFGFTPGALIVMTQNYGHGPLVVTIRGTRIALGRGEAQKIIVQKDAAE